MKRFATGLVVGKFCPLHRGHEFLIRRALDECGHVYVLSYTKPEFPGCEPSRREQWLAQLFPETERLVLTDERLCAFGGGLLPADDADADLHRSLVAWICLHIWRTAVDAVFTSEDYGDPFAAALARLFARPVAHVCVDVTRAEFPISGTKLREDIHAHRGSLSLLVYASFVQRVCLLGGESSGKTTLAAALAEEFQTECVPEFGRDLWVEKSGQLQFEDLLFIAQQQVVREETAALRAKRFIFCDTSPLTTHFYSQEMFGRSDPALEQLVARPYDFTILCAPDFPFAQDGTRRPAAFRDLQHAWYEGELARRKIPYLLSKGSLRQRVMHVGASLLSTARQ